MAKSIRARATLKGDTVTVKALITHVMETGMRKDEKTGKKIPAHFIQEVSCAHNGTEIVLAQWGPAVSKNPYLSYQFTGGQSGDDVSISWVDNKGQKDSLTTQIK
ncbi:thiosulfate oxidation carrier complex protein SoxZ [Thiohalophilus sp.]|uniref:thiosulfate oxidation carrier complex protein SoxZ n=1 Tax=Thiohalophilus sp. TaxID=3028392 RepID=UPI002ACE58F0|nr:thiosulfate oxidation carrier complex protein SoxZ [Thiohalophilus sp.]MDZ7802833.1 thiosulfate oxidation carrier complex protein SoxZ [Thiohalophilus sp.]MDZ7803524.1 thiosulfate oxidation carrier complex protein SoxZ [Thiohalophilus sp.]